MRLPSGLRAGERQKGQRHHGHREIIVSRGRLEPLGRPQAEDTVVPAGQALPLEDDREHDLAEGEREHREVCGGEADDEDAEDERPQGRKHRRRRQGQEHRQPGLLDEERRRIGAEREVRRVAERNHPAVPHEQVEGGREEPRDSDLGEELQEEWG